MNHVYHFSNLQRKSFIFLFYFNNHAEKYAWNDSFVRSRTIEESTRLFTNRKISQNESFMNDFHDFFQYSCQKLANNSNFQFIRFVSSLTKDLRTDSVVHERHYFSKWIIRERHSYFFSNNCQKKNLCEKIQSYVHSFVRSFVRFFVHKQCENRLSRSRIMIF